MGDAASEKTNQPTKTRTKFTPRADYRQQQNQRIEESPSLAETYRELKALTVESSCITAEGYGRNRQIRYSVNLTHAKSVFRLDCQNSDCVRGDYDLSTVLAQAVAARRTTVSGEMPCPGWQDKTTIDTVRCQCVLHYKLSLEY